MECRVFFVSHSKEYPRSPGDPTQDESPTPTELPELSDGEVSEDDFEGLVEMLAEEEREYDVEDDFGEFVVNEDEQESVFEDENDDDDDDVRTQPSAFNNEKAKSDERPKRRRILRKTNPSLAPEPGAWDIQIPVVARINERQPASAQSNTQVPCENADCCFSATGGPLLVRKSITDTLCVFCDTEKMLEWVSNPGKRSNITKLLKKMSESWITEHAFNFIPSEHHEYFRRMLTKTKFCEGVPQCTFALSAAGGAARIEKTFGNTCIFCSPDALQHQCLTAAGRQQIINMMSKMSLENRQKAIQDKVPELHREEIAMALSGIPVKVKRRPAAVVPAEELRDSWTASLDLRQHNAALPSEAERKRFRTKVLEDRATGRRHAERPKEERARKNEEIQNVPGLPPAKVSDRAINLERWCLFNSWGQCEGCKKMIPRDLTEQTLTKQQPPTIPKRQCNQCRFAAKEGQDKAPTPEEPPKELRGLNKETMEALSPLDIDVGIETRAKYGLGYRAKMTMMRFRWHSMSVRDRLKTIKDKEQRRKGKAAHAFLLAQTDETYSIFHAEHLAFLEEHPDANDVQRRRRLQFIERVGVEVALWPCLFWKADMTFTHERAKNRKSAESESDSGSGSGSDSSDTEEDDADTKPKASLKRIYDALALGIRLGYTEHFHLLQFLYDLHLWTDIGSKKNLHRDCPMRLMLAGSSFSPVYWKRVFSGLVDMVRQCGFPKFFWTLAPSEWTMPYHVFVEDTMKKLLKERLHLPVEETLHLSHVLIQTAKGLLMGETGSRKDWKNHIFRCTGKDGTERRFKAFLRLEFQDGTRKESTQDYHGSGRPHVHLIIFGEDDDFAGLDLANIVSATLPEDPDLQGYVKGSQLDWNGESGHPVNDEPTHFDDVAKKWRLFHSQEDHDMGLRAYIVDILDALKCHQSFDVATNDAKDWVSYLAKYLSKFSDSASDEWLDDDQDATSMATTVLMRYKPYEPEMVLQLFGRRFRQWHLNTVHGGKRNFVVPVPDAEKMPKEVDQYMRAKWARGKIPLLDFLRKTTRKGEISAWLKKLHSSTNAPGTVEDFAANYKMQGEAVVAADMNSRRSDKFYGQWLMLNKPFHKPSDFIDVDQLSKVPNEMRYMAMAILNGFGEDKNVLEKELHIEGHKPAIFQEFVDMVEAQRGQIADYLSGTLSKEPEPEISEDDESSCEHPQKKRKITYNKEQKRFQKLLRDNTGRSVAYHEAGTEQEQERVRQEALDYSKNKVLVCYGPGGSGKTTVIHDQIEELAAQGHWILFQLPTAQLASRMRQRYPTEKYPKVVIDTCHTASGLDRDAIYMPTYTKYVLIIVDEISQLNGKNSDQILELWQKEDSIPTLAIIGDKKQMASPGETRPWNTARWKKLTFKTDFRTPYRCKKDPKFGKLLKHLRVCKPHKPLMTYLKQPSKRAWNPPGPPTPEGLSRLFKAHPKTEILTCSRHGMNDVNEKALKALYPRWGPLVTLPGDMESNPFNYIENKLREPPELIPLKLFIYKGMKVFLTKNVRKDLDFVNGMLAFVKDYNEQTKALRVKTITGKTIDIWKWTDKDHGNLSYYPVRPGYASTILKFQGAELKHVTVYLDAPKVPAAAYTAISRVKKAKHFLIATASKMTPEHFTPARS